MTNTLPMNIRLMTIAVALAVALAGSFATSQPAHAIYNDYSRCGIPKCNSNTEPGGYLGT